MEFRCVKPVNESVKCRDIYLSQTNRTVFSFFEVSLKSRFEILRGGRKEAFVDEAVLLVGDIDGDDRRRSLAA
jgi:hypothetical protein